MSRPTVVGTTVSGTSMSGTTVARTVVAGTIVARTMVAGDMMAGTAVTWPMLRLASRFVSRPGPVRLRPPILARSRPGYRHGRNGRLAGPPRRGRLGGADGRRTRDGGQPGGGYLLRLTG